jgi:endonuclease YncB( thermonuclease family)
MTYAAAGKWTFYGSTLNRITDGDSFYANVAAMFDFGFHITIGGSATQKFRLNGCNAAPLSTESGRGAAAALEGLLAFPFTLQSVSPYKYGDEWMAVVTTASGLDVATVMIEQQWAAPWDGNGKQPLPPWPRTVS